MGDKGGGGNKNPLNPPLRRGKANRVKSASLKWTLSQWQWRTL